MPNNDLEEIKNRIDIVELIGSYVTLKKAGTNYKGLCPFHSEKTPSFMVSPEKQIFKCFGCSKGGDVFTFMMEIEALGFGDALKTLADKAGYKLTPRHFEGLKSGEQPGQKSRLFELNELVARLYHKILLDHPQAKVARDYLDKRGISAQTINEFNLGYAPKSWDLLLRFATSRGFTEKELVLAGLAVRRDRPSEREQKFNSYDRFRERIVFPINNILGAPVAFTGRLLVDSVDSPKYLNSSESPVYHKSSTIYGLDKAKTAIKETDLCILVEGNMDVISCHQAGFKNVVAVSGTALSREMLLILSRYSTHLAFSFDADSAGQLARKRAITLVGELDLNSFVLKLPSGFKDADEAIKADPKNWHEAVNNIKPALEDLINEVSNEAKEMADKKRVLKEILPLIKSLKSESEKEHHLKILSKKMLISENALKEELRQSKREEGQPEVTEKKIQKEQTDESKFLALYYETKSDDPIVRKAIEILSQNESYSKIILAIGKNQLPNNIMTSLSAIRLKIENEVDENKEDLASYLVDLGNKIIKKEKSKKKDAILQEIATAEGQNDKTRQRELLKKLNSVIVNDD